MSKDQPLRIRNSTAEFLVFTRQAGDEGIEVRVAEETVWLTQQRMAELFQTTTQQNISLHLQNIYAEGELQLEATHKESLSVRQEGARSVRQKVDFYNLDAIISVGYRVKSAVATRFRIWATRLLREYIVKGFILDDERLKNPDPAITKAQTAPKSSTSRWTAASPMAGRIPAISHFLERPRKPPIRKNPIQRVDMLKCET